MPGSPGEADVPGLAKQPDSVRLKQFSRQAATAAVVVLALGVGLALWWRYGLLVVLAEPSWLCAPR